MTKQVWDRVVPGLAKRISPTGHQAWVVMRRVRGQTQPTRITIGNVGRMSVPRARSEARRVIEDMDAGINPVVKRREERLGRASRARDVVNALRHLGIALTNRAQQDLQLLRVLKRELNIR